MRLLGGPVPKPWPIEYWAARDEAKAVGLHEFEGPPCIKCGSQTRWVSSGACKNCHRGNAQKLKKKRPLARAVRSAEWRAKRDGLDFDLVESELEIPKVCPVFGTSMETPSLDRLDNSKGYVRDNVRVISWEANRLKHRLSIEQARALVHYMENNQ